MLVSLYLHVVVEYTLLPVKYSIYLSTYLSLIRKKLCCGISDDDIVANFCRVYEQKNFENRYGEIMDKVCWYLL